MTARNDRSRDTGATKSRGRDETSTKERPSLDRWKPSERLATPMLPDGAHARWVREFVDGQPDKRNVNRHLADGYTLVTQAELPEDFVYEDSGDDPYVRDGGLILMKIPQHVADQIRAYYRERSVEKQRAVNNMQGIPDADAVVQDSSRRLTGAEIARSV
jgi:hypothetical protein